MSSTNFTLHSQTELCLKTWKINTMHDTTLQTRAELSSTVWINKFYSYKLQNIYTVSNDNSYIHFILIHAMLLANIVSQSGEQTKRVLTGPRLIMSPVCIDSSKSTEIKS